MNITINIQAPEIVNAILALAAALPGNQVLNLNGKEVAATAVPEAVQHQAPVTQAPPQQAPNVVPFQQQPAPTGVPTAPMQPPVQHAPVQQPLVQQAQPQTVPTSAPTYTMDQLAVAATQLMDAGRQSELVALLQSFGAQSLMMLPKEQYGAFATSLRGMGANI